MEILLVRHGETAFDAGEPRFRGQLDIELSETGLQQCTELGKWIFHTHMIDKIYYSNLTCSKETAQTIKEYQSVAQLIEEPLLRDMSFGDWAGKKVDEILNTPELKEKWNEHPETLKIPNGETINDVLKRVEELIEKLSKEKGHTIVLVSHKIVLNLILCYLFDIKPKYIWKFNMDNATITKIHLDENKNFKLLGFNDKCHLRSFKDDRTSNFKIKEDKKKKNK